MITRTRDYIYLFYRPFDFKRVGLFSRVCIDIERAPEVCSGLVGRVKIDADIRRLAFAKQRLLEFCGKAVAGRVDGVDHEVLVACIAIDKVEGIARVVLTERKVADGVIENDARRCRIFLRAREEQAEMNDEQDGNKVSTVIHCNVRIKFCEEKKRRCEHAPSQLNILFRRITQQLVVYRQGMHHQL